MTFREMYRTVYVETSPPRLRLLEAIRMIASLRGASLDLWVEYRDRRLNDRGIGGTRGARG